MTCKEMTKAIKSYEGRLKEWEKARFSPPPEPELKPIEPSMIEQVSMRDGVNLYTEVFLPVCGERGGKEKWPIIFIRSPYPFNRLSRCYASITT